jgi:hypothetical protein
MKSIRFLKKLPASVIFCLITIAAYPQSYHAINGSPYAGVSSMYVNPASTVNSAYKWDLTIFSVQEVNSQTLGTINDGSLLNYTNAYTEFTNGNRSRFFHGNLDITLFNARIKLDQKSALAFGIRGRAFINSKIMPFVYKDSLSSTQSFLYENKVENFLQGFGTHSGWVEINFNYSRILKQTYNTRLTAGATIAYTRGISGAHANVVHATYLEEKDNNNNNFYILTGGSALAEYSSNYDSLSDYKSVAGNTKAFLKDTKSGFNLNIGAEYLFKNERPYDDDALTSENYDWKIGISILDIGKNKYRPINGSFYAGNPKFTTSDTSLINNLNNANSLSAVRDTLANYFNTLDSLSSPFTISNPTRLTVSVDKNLGNHFYINGQLNINFYSTDPTAKLRTREINLLTITPRWETNKFGLYLPVQYNTQGQIWVGGAAKLGPLLIGFHSLDFYKWFKVHTQTYNGGGYIMLNIHPFRKKEYDGIDCP